MSRPVRNALLILAAAAAIVRPAAAAEAAPVASAIVLRLQPDLANGTVRGSQQTTLQRAPGTAAWGRLRWPLHGLQIDTLTLEGGAVAWQVVDGALQLAVPPHFTDRRTLRLQLRYHGKPAEGLYTAPDSAHTAWATCHWMVCAPNDDGPGQRVRFALDLLLPAGLDAVASGPPQRAPQPLPGGYRLHRWRLDVPHSTHLLGFAVGRFVVRDGRAADGTRLHTRVSDQPGAERAANWADRAAGELPQMVDFFAARAGVPLPGGRYTQVVVPGTVTQEAAQLSLIGSRWAAALDSDETDDWAFAHELAHQWWGNSVACADWSHFWLNEGMATFMSAAWQQHRWGEAAYQRELQRARARWQRAIDAGADRPLAATAPYPSLVLRRAIQYSKAMLFLHALRRELGETAFWRGVAGYTRAHAGRAVVSADFQAAMERAAARSLQPLFASWVTGGAPAPAP